MVKQKCMRCGKSKELANNNLCIDCLNNSEPFIKEIKFNRVSICNVCGSYSYSKEKKWIKNNKLFKKLSKEEQDFYELGSEYFFNFLIKEVIEKGLKINRIYTLKNISFKIEFLKNESTDKKVIYNVELRLKLNDEKTFNYTKKIRFVILYSICPICQKNLSNYFEGIIQLRGKDNENYDLAEQDLINLIEKKRNVEINKLVRTKNGADFYLTNKKVMLEFALNIHKKYGGILEQNSQLFSYNNQSSKAIYRVNTLLRLPDFNHFDILDIKNINFLVLKVHGKNVSGIDLNSGKSREIDFNNNDYDIIYRRDELLFKTTISKVYPEIEILNRNYESVSAINLSSRDKSKFNIGTKVSVINFKNKYYIIK